MKEITPLPWQHDSGNIFTFIHKPGRTATCSTLIAELCDGNNWKEDGDFIIKACNNHEKLVKALKECLNKLDCGWGQYDKNYDAIYQARAALKALEDKP
jgi:hypothetical protein